MKEDKILIGIKKHPRSYKNKCTHDDLRKDFQQLDDLYEYLIENLLSSSYLFYKGGGDKGNLPAIRFLIDKPDFFLFKMAFPNWNEFMFRNGIFSWWKDTFNCDHAVNNHAIGHSPIGSVGPIGYDVFLKELNKKRFKNEN